MSEEPFDELRRIGERRPVPSFSEDRKRAIFEAARRRIEDKTVQKRGIHWKRIAVGFAAAACLALAIFWPTEAVKHQAEAIVFPEQPRGVAKRDASVEPELWQVKSIEFQEVDGVVYDIPVITYEVKPMVDIETGDSDEQI
ncbi:hypothetical protein K8I31_07360 [bacterium]|nr:hypothetical protein [bacterium]